MLKFFRPYFFAALVISYFLTVVGMPVYTHYCGDEVEEVSYLVKTNGCCGDEVPDGNSCCHDEGLVLSNKVDFTIKDFSSHIHLAVTDLFYFLPDQLLPVTSEGFCANFTNSGCAPPFQNSRLAEIVVLKI